MKPQQTCTGSYARKCTSVEVQSGYCIKHYICHLSSNLISANCSSVVYLRNICEIPAALAASTGKSSSSDDVICQTEISHLLTYVSNETARDVRSLMSCLRRRRTRPGTFCPRLLHEAVCSARTLSTCARLVSPCDGAARHHFVLVCSGRCVHVELVSLVNALTETYADICVFVEQTRLTGRQNVYAMG